MAVLYYGCAVLYPSQVTSVVNKKRGGLFSKILRVIAVLVLLNLFLHLLFANLTGQSGVSVVSHRGAADIAPENTMAAVRAGVQAGAPFIEIDVRLTADGVLVLMHDSTVDRTTGGTGSVGELKWEYIQNLDAGGYFGSGFEGEPVPDLGTVLEYMKGKSSTLVIEVKAPGGNPRIGDLLARLIEEHAMEKEVVVISFNGGWVVEFGSILPDVSLGALYIYPLLPPPAKDVRFLSVYWPSYVIDPTLVWRMHKNGYKVWAWNVDNYYVVRFLSWKGVDGIVLDKPWLLNEH